MDEIIRFALERYKVINKRSHIPDEIEDLIRWLIKRKADTEGLNVADTYVSDGTIWIDLIEHKDKHGL